MSLQNFQSCSLHNNKNISLPCGINTCKICLLETKEKFFKCFHCNQNFNKNEIPFNFNKYAKK